MLDIEQKNICFECKKELIQKSNKSQRFFCDDKCRMSYNQKNKNNDEISIKICKICSATFYPRALSSKYCSPPCRQKGHLKRQYIREDLHPEKSKKYQSDYRKRNNQAVKKSRLKNWYGITLEEYDQILKEQNNKCPICKIELDGGKYTHLDHKHGESGLSSIRGITCSACNTMLGFAKDSTKIFESAIEYLKKFENKNGD